MNHVNLTRLTVLFCVLSAGCHVYKEELVTAKSQSALTCELKKLPEMPAASDDGTDLGEQWFALVDVELDQSGDRWAQIGYDMDGLCTPDNDPRAPVRCATRGGRFPAADGVGGVDNYAGEYPLQAAIKQMPYLQTELRSAERWGVTQALRIRGWNGQDNDPDVRIAILDAVFALPKDSTFTPQSSVSASPLVDGWNYGPPQWDGTDRLWVSSASVVNNDPTQPAEEYVAYVSNRHFVVHSQARSLTPMNAATFSTQFGFSQEVFSGRISDDGTHLENVTWQGRWDVNNIVDAITAKTFVCQNGTVEYDLLLDSATRMADMRLDPATEDEGLECDALSTAIGFIGYPVTFGGMAEPAPPPDPCIAHPAN